MRVLEDHEHRLLAGQTFELTDQRFQGPLLFALRAEVGQRVAVRSWQCEQIDDECQILIGRRGASEQGFELPQPGSRRIIRQEPRCPTELVDERVKGRCPDDRASRNSAGGYGARR